MIERRERERKVEGEIREREREREREGGRERDIYIERGERDREVKGAQRKSNPLPNAFLKLCEWYLSDLLQYF